MPRTKYPKVIHEPATVFRFTHGRPPTFATPEEMAKAIDDYFLSCHEIQKDKKTSAPIIDPETNEPLYVKIRPYTVAGLARHLGLTTEGLRNYESTKSDTYIPFFWTVRSAKQIIEEQLEDLLITSKGQVQGVIFNLKNNFARTWKDKTEQTIDMNANATINDERAKATRERMLQELEEDTEAE